MKRIKHKSKLMILAILSILLLFSFPSSSQYTLASANTTEGFIIEADEITGTLGIPLIVLGETASKKGVPMIDLAMDNVEVKGLVIKKVTQTPNGPMTTVIKSNGAAKLKKMRVQITNMETGGIFIPKFGYLGLKKVKLLAYKQTADIADLPNFSFSLESGVGSQMEDKNEEELKELIKSLDEGTKEDEKEEGEKGDPNQQKEQNKEEDKQEQESDKPSGEQPATEPKQPETENPDIEPNPSEPTKPEEGTENPEDNQVEPDSKKDGSDTGDENAKSDTPPPASGS